MVKHLSTRHRDTSVYLHVDDISNLVKARSQQELSSKAFRWAKDLKQCTVELKLDISDKSVAVPVCRAAEDFRALQDASQAQAVIISSVVRLLAVVVHAQQVRPAAALALLRRADIVRRQHGSHA